MSDLTEGIVPLHKTASLKPLQPPKLSAVSSECVAQRIKITVPHRLDHYVPGILHAPNKVVNSEAAVIFISGAGGGTSGPAGMWVSLANKLARLCNVPALRLDYREPSSTKYCTEDVLAAVSFLNGRLAATEFLLVCWSFGSAPAFTAASQDDRIRGIACVAPQTSDTSRVQTFSPRPLLLLHGTGDRVLSDRCSKQLFEAYGDRPGGDRTLKSYEGDDHGLTNHAIEAEQAIFHFAAKVLGREISGEEAGDAPGAELIGGREERIDLMKQGHDLEGESL